MTHLDLHDDHLGYWPSPWPVECGGNRRQKAAAGRLDAATGTPSVVTRRNGRWNVMVVGREPDEWYLGGTMAAFSGPPPFGWVERIHPTTLKPVASSPRLPCGDHVWCGAIMAHANGSILSVNGSYMHRLDADDLSVIAERRLPVDRSHNGMLALSDGTVITKDLRLEGQEGTTITRLDADTLELVHEPFVLAEASMGRIAADIDSTGRELVYVPGTEHIWRLEVCPDRLDADDWRPRYRSRNDRWGLAWDSCLSDGMCWLMDCGDIEAVRRIHYNNPNGRFEVAPGRALSRRLPAPREGAQRLLACNLNDDSDVRQIEPFGTPGGGIIAPPVHVADYSMAIAWDSINGGLAGISTQDDSLKVVWHLDIRPTMQPVVFPESGELAINDFTTAGTDDIVVVDIVTGELLDRAHTGSAIANGMFLTPDSNRGLYYCTTTTLAHITWN